jgi:KDO2-lipid IV(A) lauroyltransferase
MIILYFLVFGLLWLISHLPLSILYFFSDVVFVLIFHVFKYRRKVVIKNLRASFPNKSDIEINKVERAFYRHFCDYFIETIKLLNMSEADIKKRVTLINPEVLDEYYDNNKSIFLYLGHYANWEWLSYAWTVNRPAYTDYKMYIAYYPLGSKYLERFFVYLRSKKSKGIPVAQKKILRTIIKINQEGKKGIFIFIADQSPTRNSVQHWLTFLNQDTAPIVGPDKLSKQTGYPAFYYKIRKLKRGHYSCEFVKLAEDPNKVPEYAITERYFEELEKSIIEDPSVWLWTHRRWKFDKATFRKHSDK